MNINEMLEIASGPVIGSVIGYFTNYIAVKMLFKPHNSVKVFGKTLPFTPGIIPKRKDELARSIGNAVSQNLLTGDDLQKMLTGDSVKKEISQGVLQGILSDDSSVEALMLKITNSDKAFKIKQSSADILTQKIVNGLLSINFEQLIRTKGTDAILSSLKGSMIGMFVNEALVSKFATPVSEKLKEYVDEQGYDEIKPLVEKEIQKIASMPVPSVLEKFGANEDAISAFVEKLYEGFINDKLKKVIADFDVSAIIEQKINAMSVAEIEKMVLDVMSKELNAIVSLGALIGFIIGLINLLFR